jgi:hypothetical protein
LIVLFPDRLQFLLQRIAAISLGLGEYIGVFPRTGAGTKPEFLGVREDTQPVSAFAALQIPVVSPPAAGKALLQTQVVEFFGSLFKDNSTCLTLVVQNRL